MRRRPDRHREELPRRRERDFDRPRLIVREVERVVLVRYGDLHASANRTDVQRQHERRGAIRGDQH
jgi:hypothetical protein